MKKAMKPIGLAAAALVLTASLVTATYAWFTSNKVADTNRVSGRVGNDDVKLLISSNGSQGSTEATIAQVNSTSLTELLPVSTADLKSFVYNPGTVDGVAIHFEQVEEEKYYFHGRVYLQAAATNPNPNAKLALYLDETEENGGKLFKQQSGYVGNAARLGLTFDNNSPIIFRFSDDHNPESGLAGQTVLNGQMLTDNQVLNGTGGSIFAVADPSVLVSDCIVPNDVNASGMKKPITYLELNRVYPVDIYFYIEGCDPDCTNEIQLNQLDLHLAFYGVLTEEVNG